MALVYVVATVTLVGLGPGDPVWAEESDPQVARWLRGGQLRRLDPPDAKPEEKAKPAKRPRPKRPSPMLSEKR